MKLGNESLSQNLKTHVDSIRNHIDAGQTEHEGIEPSGWRHGGEKFSKDVKLLETKIHEELTTQGVHVIACTVRHFLKGASLRNRLYPAARLLIIPIAGSSTLSGVSLPIDTFCDLEDRQMLSEEESDVVVVLYKIAPGS